MVRILAPVLDDVFYDFGCGKRRILSWHFKRVVGIDLFDELCQKARENAGRLRGKMSPIDVICEDQQELIIQMTLSLQCLILLEKKHCAQ